MSAPLITSYAPLPQSPSPWPTLDPFLFCVHHNDQYPAGQDDMSPKASLSGRHIGSDFSNKEGWSMYHGHKAPGFPEHPHRGFETLTLARQGFIDHSDSLGATARFGQGDAQWMTAGAGVVHAEMFPLMNREAPNPTELFQIWINLPSKDKMAPAHFTMLWSEELPTLWVSGGEVSRASVEAKRAPLPVGARPIAEVTAVAGELGGVKLPAPPPHSWASRPEHAVAVWSIRLQPGASLTLPPAPKGAHRTLYVFEGPKGGVLNVSEASGAELTSPALTREGEAQERVLLRHAATLAAERATHLSNPSTDQNAEPVQALILQGTPIGEPVAQRGPFVMNTQAEISQTIRDYQRTGFGGWGWGRRDPTHPRDAGRFALHADGREERKG